MGKMDKTRENTCCMTGHRKLPAGQEALIKEKVKAAVRTLLAKGVTHFEIGGAIGFDTLAEEAVLEMKEENAAISLHLILPCKDQEKKWSSAEKEAYRRILAEADEVVCLAEHYFKGCMLKRDRRLVDDSAHCICFLTQEDGGTKYTVNYALKHKLNVINIAEGLTE